MDDINEKDQYGRTELWNAVFYENIDDARQLLNQNADPNIGETRSNISPLMLSSQLRNSILLEMLLDHGANINSRDCNGETALHYAIEERRDKKTKKEEKYKIVNILLKNNAALNVLSKSKFSPLHIASLYGEHHIVKLLIEYGANINIKGEEDWTPLVEACTNQHYTTMNLLLNNGADIDFEHSFWCSGHQYETPEINHIVKRSIEEKILKQKILSGSANIDEQLIDSVIQNDIGKVQTLIETGANINRGIRCKESREKYTEYTALMWASYKGNLNIMELLLEKGWDANHYDDMGTPLQWACEGGQMDAVKILLDKRAIINAPGPRGITALAWACINGHYDIVNILLNNGAEVNYSMSIGKYENFPPLSLIKASKYNHIDIVKLLLDNGADLNSCDYKEGTAITSAAKYGNIEILQLLLKDNTAADLNIYNRSRGWAAIHYGVINNSYDIVKLLIDNGANVNILTNNHREYEKETALDMAISHFHNNIADLLKKSGGKTRNQLIQ